MLPALWRIPRTGGQLLFLGGRATGPKEHHPDKKRQQAEYSAEHEKLGRPGG